MRSMEIHRQGAGPKVALIHGGPGAQGSMRGLADSLAEDFDVWELWQSRGGGAEPLTVDRHIRELLDETPQDVTWVGHSWGAMLGCLAAAQRSPSKLVLVGSGTFGSKARQEYERRMTRALGDEGRAQKAHLKAELAGADEEKRLRIFSQLGEIADSAMSPRLLTEELPCEIDPVGHKETWDDRLRLGDLAPLCAGITCPVSMIHGDLDPHPAEEIHSELQPFVPQVQLRLLSGAGHTPWREPDARQEFYSLLGEELRG